MNNAYDIKIYKKNNNTITKEKHTELYEYYTI